MITNLLSSKASGHFTLMGMNSATGKTLLCIRILAAKILSVTDVKGFDYCTSIPYDPSKTTKKNVGRGKKFTGLPVWKFNGELIPGLMWMYPKVSIIYDILTEALKYLDQLNVFERLQDGPTQFGLLGGHVSRLQLPLLEYINYTTPDEQSKWIFTLGTPNTKHIWC